MLHVAGLRLVVAAVAALLCVVGLASPVRGQDVKGGEASGLVLTAQPVEHLTSPRPERRPAALLPLYISFGILQGLDAHSTLRALPRGAVEQNPLMKGFATHGVGLLAVKAGGAASVFYASERMWRRNKTAAVVFMVAANSAMAWVVQHNYRVSYTR